MAALTGLQMIQNFASVYPAIASFMDILAGAIGTIMGIKGFMDVMHAGKRHESPKAGFGWIVGGSVMLEVAWAMKTATQTFFPGAQPLSAMAYAHPSGSAAQVLAQAAVGLIIILGTASGMRGVWMLHGVSKGHDTFWPGVTLLLSGGLAVNIVMVVGAITTQVGLGTGWESTLGL